MERPSHQDESIVDVCIRSYADTGALFGLLAANALPADAVLAAGRIVKIEDGKIRPMTRVAGRPQTLEAAAQSQAVVYAGQNLPDLALQEYGATEGLLQLMVRNDLAADAALAPGRMLAIAPQKVRADVADYYRRRRHRVNTGADLPARPAEGEYDEGYAGDYTS